MNLKEVNKVSIAAVSSLIFLYFMLENIFHAENGYIVVSGIAVCYFLFGFFSQGNQAGNKSIPGSLKNNILYIIFITTAVIILYLL